MPQTRPRSTWRGGLDERPLTRSELALDQDGGELLRRAHGVPRTSYATTCDLNDTPSALSTRLAGKTATGALLHDTFAFFRGFAALPGCERTASRGCLAFSPSARIRASIVF